MLEKQLITYLNIISSLKVIFVLFVAKYMDNTLCCNYGEDAGCRFLDTGFIKVIIFFYPASSIQYPVSETLWNKRSFSAGSSKFRVQGSKLKSDIIFNSTWNVEP